jgi:lipoprotein-releasing system permease protein|tara:strand:- start:2570 stop:3772 length:1203 start_codon:yes stop_codon:yes gene_type:complete
VRFPLYIASRYFFTRSKQSVINIINYIALSVVLIATAALLIVLSAFTGLKDFGLSFSNVFDPDFRVEAVQGKVLEVDSVGLASMKQLDGILAVSGIIEDKVFLNYRDKNHVVYLKGVDSTYQKVIESDRFLSSGAWFSKELDEVVIGGGVAQVLSLGVYDYNDFLVLTVPKRSASATQLKEPFINKTALVSGIYSVSEELDKKYMFSNLSFARDLFQRKGNVYSSLELKVDPSLNRKQLEEQLQALLKTPIRIRSRTELNAALFKMLNTEQMAIYLIFTLVIIIALFNVVGALIMMILEKRPQLKVLYALGVQPKEIRLIFFYLGGMISWVGGGLGILLGTTLVLLQRYFPFLYVPGTNFPYPVRLELQNVAMVLLLLLVLGGLASAWATAQVGKRIKLL